MRCVAGMLSALVELKRATDAPLFSTTVTVSQFLCKAGLVLKEEEGSEDAAAAESVRVDILNRNCDIFNWSARTGNSYMLIFRNRRLRFTATFSFL